MAHSSVTCLHQNVKLLDEVAVYCFSNRTGRKQTTLKFQNDTCNVRTPRSVPTVEVSMNTKHCHTESTGWELSRKEQQYSNAFLCWSTHRVLETHCVGAEVHLHTFSISVVDGSDRKLPTWRKGRRYAFQFASHSDVTTTTNPLQYKHITDLQCNYEAHFSALPRAKIFSTATVTLHCDRSASRVTISGSLLSHLRQVRNPAQLFVQG